MSYQLEVNFEQLALMGGNNINGTGNLGANAIGGNSGDNRLSGQAGNDSLAGNAGDDVLLGGLGVDSLLGGDGNDRLLGRTSADTLNGGDGDDSLIGGSGKDLIVTGTGADTIIFQAPDDTAFTQANADVISDFFQSLDVIDLSRIDAKTGNAALNDAFVFIGAAAFSNVAGQLHAVQVAGATYVEYDVNGDSVADGVIKLTGLLTLTSADFVL